MTNDTSWSGRVLPYANFRLDLLWSCKLQMLLILVLWSLMQILVWIYSGVVSYECT